MIKSFSIAAMAVLVMVGCNSGSNDSAEVEAATVADAVKLAENLGASAAVGQGLNEQGENSLSSLSTKSRAVFTESCLNGGSMLFDFDEAQFIYGQESSDLEMSMEAQNCVNDGTTTNGKMTFKMEGEETIIISFPTAYSVVGNGENVTIDAGGSFKIEEQYPYEVITINMTMTDGTETFSGKNLVYKIQENSDGSSAIFPASGSEDFGTGYFKVDPSYNASQTPMVSDFDGNLQAGGLFKYLDAVNHKVEVEATATNEVTVRVDENGNGTFESDEIETVSVDS